MGAMPIIHPRGLFTNPNPLSRVPDGALLRAVNTVINREGIHDRRHGFESFGTSILAPGDRLRRLFSYQSRLLAHFGSTLLYDSTGAGAFVPFIGSFSPPSGNAFVRALQAAKNFFLATSTGIRKMDAYNAEPTNAGGIKALDGVATTTGASGFLATANQVAYRIVWGYKDANKNLILGPPSQRIIGVNSSGGDRDMSITFQVPQGVTEGHFYQIYRSPASGGVDVEPNDELGLVYEEYLPEGGEFLAVLTASNSPYMTLYKKEGGSLTKLADPADAPTSAAIAGWSSDGVFLAVGCASAPRIVIYRRAGDVFTKLTDPADLPSNTVGSVSFSPNGNILALGFASAPFHFFYSRSGETFTKLADLAIDSYAPEFSPDGGHFVISEVFTAKLALYSVSGTTFTKVSESVALTGLGPQEPHWSPDGNFISVHLAASPYIAIFQVSGTTMTRLANPSVLPTDQGTGSAFSPNGEYLAVSHLSSPYLTVYKRNGTTFTKIADPATLPAGNGGEVSWSPDGTILTVAHAGSPFITNYSLVADVLTKLADPAVLPDGGPNAAIWSGNFQNLNRELTVTDITPENLRGATIYTAASQQGIEEANDAPPLVKDMALYKNMVLYGNTVSKHRLFLTLIAVGATDGFQVADTITIGGVTYTGAAAEDADANEFLVEDGETPAENIDITARSLVRVINQSLDNTAYYAYYMSGYDDLPGKILIEERVFGGSAIVLTSDRGGAFNPTVPASGVTLATEAETNLNGLYVSKPLQPEAVPLKNIYYVGAADKAILRVIALTDSAFILKEDGVFRVTGTDPENLAISLFDSTVILKAPESACVFNNQIVCYTSQGFVSISDVGVSIIGVPVEDIFKNAQYLITNFAAQSYCVPQDSERRLLFFMRTDGNITVFGGAVASDFPTINTPCMVYNSLTGEWSGPWDIEASAAIQNPVDDKLYCADFLSSNINFHKEKKTFAVADYNDGLLGTITVTGVSGVVLTISTSSVPVLGAVVQDSSGNQVKISKVTSSTIIEVEEAGIVGVGALSVYAPIVVDLVTTPVFGKNPATVKHYSDATLFLRDSAAAKVEVGFETDISPGFTKTEPDREALAATCSTSGLRARKTLVPQEKRRGRFAMLNIKSHNVGESLGFCGVVLGVDEVSDRAK